MSENDTIFGDILKTISNYPVENWSNDKNWEFTCINSQQRQVTIYAELYRFGRGETSTAGIKIDGELLVKAKLSSPLGDQIYRLVADVRGKVAIHRLKQLRAGGKAVGATDEINRQETEKILEDLRRRGNSPKDLGL